jgi:hypothetical protein
MSSIQDLFFSKSKTSAELKREIGHPNPNHVAAFIPSREFSHIMRRFVHDESFERGGKERRKKFKLRRYQNAYAKGKCLLSGNNTNKVAGGDLQEMLEN